MSATIVFILPSTPGNLSKKVDFRTCAKKLGPYPYCEFQKLRQKKHIAICIHNRMGPVYVSPARTLRSRIPEFHFRNSGIPEFWDSLGDLLTLWTLRNGRCRYLAKLLWGGGTLGKK